jgi:hypothetical protein
VLHVHVGEAAGVGRGDQNVQPRHHALRPKPVYPLLDLFAKLLGNGFAVEDLGAHIELEDTCWAGARESWKAGT